MNKNDWYRNRILWKASQHKLFDKSCCEFSDLGSEQILSITEKIPGEDDLVIVFWDNHGKWTVVGTGNVYSFYNSELVSIELDKISKKLSVVTPDEAEQPNDIKRDSCFVRSDVTGQLVWAPPGSELFALMSILQMFPLKNRNTE